MLRRFRLTLTWTGFYGGQDKQESGSEEESVIHAHLGDSYDAVKRTWQELLVNWAPLHAERRFVPDDLQKDFTKLTRIPMLPNHSPTSYSILNDPDTGIRLPGERNQSEGRKHIRMKKIAAQLRNGSQCVVTFDQSTYRHSKLKRKEQLQAKMRWLANQGLHSFYYVSHAPFLFAFPDADALQRVYCILKNAGIPQNRIEKLTS